jgi:hypothetical protein
MGHSAGGKVRVVRMARILCMFVHHLHILWASVCAFAHHQPAYSHPAWVGVRVFVHHFLVHSTLPPPHSKHLFLPVNKHVRIRNYHLRGFSFTQRSRHETLAELLLEELSHDLLHGHCAVVLNRQHQWVPFKRQGFVCMRGGGACVVKRQGIRAIVNVRVSREFVNGIEHESEKCSLTLYPVCRVHVST